MSFFLCIGKVFFAVGGIIVVAIGMFIVPSVGWRWYLLVSSIPAVSVTAMSFVSGSGVVFILEVYSVMDCSCENCLLYFF